MISPSLTLDFTSASLDSRITFARTGATATRVNSSGFVEVVAANTPRFDYNPTNLVCRGLLVEETRANLITYSSTFDNAAWTKLTGGTGVAPVVTPGYPAPDGTNTAYRVQLNRGVGNTASDFSLLRNNQSDGTSIKVRSIYIKSNTVSPQTVSLIATRADNIVTATTSWTRVAGAATTASQIDIANYGPLGTTRDVDIIVWGAQIEIGNLSTSFIPTVASAVTRNADVATITGTAFSGIWRSGPGSLLVRALPSTVSGTRPLVQVDDATADNIIALRGNTTNPELYIRAGGSDQATIDAGTISAAAYRLAGAWQAGSAAASLNSGLAINGAPASIPAVTQMRLGSDGTNYLNGHLQAVQYWPLRLSNASLQNASSTAGYQSIIHPVLQDTIITEPV